MEGKDLEKGVVTRSKSQNQKKEMKASASNPRRAPKLKRMKTRTNVPAPPDSPDSNETDEDYREFLKTYDPQDTYPLSSHSGEEAESQITVESGEKTPQSSKMKSPSK